MLVTELKLILVLKHIFHPTRINFQNGNSWCFQEVTDLTVIFVAKNIAQRSESYQFYQISPTYHMAVWQQEL